ncbi:MAG TPA: hypothetical protein VGS41_12200, partial [Chthonomonadales bacterium]|nr:hypothetical protein [Chthonomonadales bacterium]
SAMIRRSMAPRAGFDLRLEAFSDYLFLVETSLNGPIHALDETLARYRVHSGSFSGAGPADHEDIWLTLELLEQTYPALRSAVRQARAHLGYRRARARYSKGDLRGAREALLQSLANEIRPKSLVWLALLSFLSITRR